MKKDFSITIDFNEIPVKTVLELVNKGVLPAAMNDYKIRNGRYVFGYYSCSVCGKIKFGKYIFPHLNVRHGLGLRFRITRERGVGEIFKINDVQSQ